MRRAEYWLLFTELCERYPGGVEVFYEDYWWRCRVHLPEGVRSGMAQDIRGAIEVVATNLKRERDA
jgi:hypothetical protein